MTCKEFRPFNLQTLPDVLEKLDRELDRFNGAGTKTRADMSDHTVNFATTAWHMVDWAWDGIDSLKDGDRTRLENHLKASWADFPAFRDWAIEQCPELEACRQIVNGSKHVGTTMYTRAPAVSTTASATSSLAGVALHEIVKAEHWTLNIKNSARSRILANGRPPSRFHPGFSILDVGCGVRSQYRLVAHRPSSRAAD